MNHGNDPDSRARAGQLWDEGAGPGTFSAHHGYRHAISPRVATRSGDGADREKRRRWRRRNSVGSISSRYPTGKRTFCGWRSIGFRVTNQERKRKPWRTDKKQSQLVAPNGFGQRAAFNVSGLFYNLGRRLRTVARDPQNQMDLRPTGRQQDEALRAEARLGNALAAELRATARSRDSTLTPMVATLCQQLAACVRDKRRTFRCEVTR